MTKGLLISAQKKNELSKKIKKYPNNTNLRHYYIKYRNKFTSLIRAAKISYYKNKFNKTISDPKLTWKLINKLTDDKNNENNAIFKNNIENNGKIINSQDNPIQAANIFNNYFVSVGEEYNKKFKNTYSKCIDKVCNFNFNSYFVKKIEETEVLNIINDLKDETASGFDKITVKILKLISKYISGPLTYIYNLCLKQSIFPDKFKLAIVKPLYKIGIK